jgi:hypothetical protein
MFLERLDERSVLSALVGGVANPNETVNTSLSATQLAQALVGSGVLVSNANFTGSAGSTGSFAFNDPTVIGFGQGIVLSSGNAADVVGPNASDSTSTAHGEGGLGGPGDAELSALAGYPTYDAAVLEFDFTPTANQVVFSYAFASDEYPEWVDTEFNDVFAFYVNGTNYAMVRQVAGDPASPFVPVAVNNINNSNPVHDPQPTPMRPDLFRANYYNPNGPSAIDLEQDGITHVLTFQAPVIAGVSNHMKLAIADASDGVWDSAVFIQAGSLVSNENPVADLSLSTEKGAAPLPVTAIVEGEDPNGLPLTYSINWGDGTTSSGPLNSPTDDSEKTTTVDHIYAAAGKYFVTLTVSNGSLSSTSIEDVEVTGVGQAAEPVVTSDPVDQTAVEGDLFTFTASATGVPEPTVQWQVSNDFGLTFVDIPGATYTAYSAVASLADQGALYQAVFTNDEGTAVTNPASLTVIPLDIVAPDAPVVGLLEDTGSSALDYITSNGMLSVSGVEAGASLEYSSDDGDTWLSEFTAAEGLNSVLVRQTDAAGNVSDAASLAFTLDTLAPVAPSVTLTSDTGSSTSDLLTNVGSLTIGLVDDGAAVEYSTDGGLAWNGSFSAQEGLNAVSVQQTDLAGNVSPVTVLSFTLDTTPPQLAPTFSTTQPILVNAKNVTVSPNATDAGGIASQAAGSVDTATAGQKSLQCSATDLAGNTASVSVPYVVGYAVSNVTPQAGATFKSKGTIPVSFQLSDANGLLSDQAAGGLAGKITVTFDGQTMGTVKYNKKSNTFSLAMKIGKQTSGPHTVAIHVTVNGAEVTTVTIPVNVV